LHLATYLFLHDQDKVHEYPSICQQLLYRYCLHRHNSCRMKQKGSSIPLSGKETELLLHQYCQYTVRFHRGNDWRAHATLQAVGDEVDHSVVELTVCHPTTTQKSSKGFLFHR